MPKSHFGYQSPKKTHKTFACTIGLANGMNISVLSKILGHASIQVTLDSYATVIDSLMLQNVKEFKSKLVTSNDDTSIS